MNEYTCPWSSTEYLTAFALCVYFGSGFVYYPGFKYVTTGVVRPVAAL